MVDDERRRTVDDYRTSLYNAISKRRDEIIATLRESAPRGKQEASQRNKGATRGAAPPAAAAPLTSSQSTSVQSQSAASSHRTSATVAAHPQHERAPGVTRATGAILAQDADRRGSRTDRPASAASAADGRPAVLVPVSGTARTSRAGSQPPTTLATPRGAASSALGATHEEKHGRHSSSALTSSAHPRPGSHTSSRPGSGDLRIGRGSGLGHSLRNASSVFGPVAEDVLLRGQSRGDGQDRRRYPRPSGQWRQDTPHSRLRRNSKEDLQPTLPGSAGP